MSFLTKRIKAKSKKVIKGAFNIAAMEMILAAQKDEQIVGRVELLELNLKMRLANEFDFEIDFESEEQSDEVLDFIDSVYKTAEQQTDAYITNTTNHRSFNGWAAKNDIMYFMRWNAGKTELTLHVAEEAGVDPITKAKKEAEVEVEKEA